ncbi:MAG TPA: DUF3141 domain-containing protein [Rhodopila sp.]|nr:DUF3141 domain-containing protein [Rhodopila sp.]
MTAWQTINDFQEYWLDAWQRSILSLDVLRQRANIHLEHTAKEVPHVLKFAAELVRDGRTLGRPVNYALVRIIPPADQPPDPTKAPFIVVDPRAGHGPGIGGMKRDSEIGVILAAGHPCYFIGFLPTPVPGQTVEDVFQAEAVFVKDVAARHADAEGKPVIIANCQAGWQIMMMAALHPDLCGPIMLAGSPLSYWAGVRGKNPMRYLGGVLGGTWLTALAGDLGNGIFDGAHLVANFESLDPSNTLWAKGYNVYSKVDTEVDRFLDFETWFGSPVLLNAAEMQWIADNLFVGNKLAAGQIRTTDGIRIDLRNIRSPVVVFCSWGDNITPPHQALGWILDLYEHEREIVADGQTIIYTMHESIGHLGIFVSGKVATKEHGEFVSCMEMIDLLPPGLYEAVITEVDADTSNRDLVQGRYLFRLEARTLNHIRAIGGNTPEDERRFAAAARVSEINRGLYETFLAPVLRDRVTEQVAETLRATHPNRVRFGIYADANPLMRPVRELAESIRADRKPADPDNPWLAMERATSLWITAALDGYRDIRDAMTEATFLTIYGSPMLQALVGLPRPESATGRRIERDLARENAVARVKVELEQRYQIGQLEEAVVRALLYIRMPDGIVDERGFTMLRLIRDAMPPDKRIGLARFKAMVREQFLLVALNPDRAIETLPALIGNNTAERKAAVDILHRIISAPGALSDEGKRRLARVETLFAPAPKPKKPEAVEVADG